MDAEQHDRQAVRIEAVRAAIAMTKPGASPAELLGYAEKVEAWIRRPPTAADLKAENRAEPPCH